MAWRDNLREASFRGVKFFVDTSQKALGRRSVLHEFPNRETPFTEDMGKVAESFEIEGHIIGDDYDKAKRKLEDAFNKYGPGELIHPFEGSKFVQVGAVNFSESMHEGAILTFTAKFFEAGDNKFPKGVNDKEAILNDATDRALENAKKEFDDNFSIKDMPGFAIQTAIDSIEAAQKQFDEVTKTFSDIADVTAQVAYSTRSLVAEVNDLLQAPSKLSQRLLDSFSLLEESFSIAKDRTNALGTFFDFGNDIEIVEHDTPTRLREKENKRQLDNFMRRVASIKAAKNAQYVDYVSLEEAEDKRVKITDVIEAQIKESDLDDFIQDMYDVNAALVDAVPDVDSALPSIKTIEVENTTSSLELAYELFEDPKKEQDIISRNDISNPCFIHAGEKIEVIGAK